MNNKQPYAMHGVLLYQVYSSYGKLSEASTPENIAYVIYPTVKMGELK